MGTQPLCPKRGAAPPQFSAHFYCSQTAGCIKMPLGMEVGLLPGDFGLDGDPALLPKNGVEPPEFSAHFYCGQTRGCIKMPLGMEVGLLPGDSAPKRAEPPNFWPTFIVAKRLHRSRCHLVRSIGLGLRDIVLDGDPAPPPP